jgi:hypothetical protein
VVSARIESISIVKTRESSIGRPGKGRGDNEATGAVGPFSGGFESGFLCDFWFRAPVGLTIFFETPFDFVLVLRVFFLAMFFTGLSRAG